MAAPNACTCCCFCWQITAECHFHPYSCGSNEYMQFFTSSCEPHHHTLQRTGITPNEIRFICHFVTVIPRAFVLAPPQISPPPVRPTEQDLDFPCQKARPESEFFISVIIRLATQDEVVLKAVLCLGASHLIRCLSSATPPASTSLALASADTVKERLVSEKDALVESTEHALSRGVDALCNRLKQFETPDELLQEAEALIAGCCVLYLYEISEGASNGSWQRWLNGPRDVLISHMDARRTRQAESGADVLPIHQPFMEFFRYHHILGNLTDHAQLYNDISSSKWRNILRHSRVSNEVLPLDLIARIAALRLKAGVAPSGSVIAQSVAIWKDLDDWEPRVVGTELPFAYHALAHSYTAACFTWLFSILYPDNIADEKVQVVVRRCLEHLSSIRTIGIHQFLLFPIFVVGMACIRQEDRTVLEGLLIKMEMYCRGNVDACSRLIRKTWESYDAGVERSWDWTYLVEPDGVSVAIV